jgi:branched-chain amino acid transport system substrate-binding protein
MLSLKVFIKNKEEESQVKINNRIFLIMVLVLTFMFSAIFNPATSMAAKANAKSKSASADEEHSWAGKINAAFDVSKMSDMSGYDPKKYVNPTGDTIKIAVVSSFSGPGAVNGELHFLPISWAAYDINKRGGIWVDGKKKLIEVIKADHMSKPDQCKKICERLILQDKVNVLMGTNGSHLMKIINDVANKHKVIAWNFTAPADDMQDATNFGRYSFAGGYSTGQMGRAMAYYYGQIKKKENKFYILCQDYLLGHALADSFKTGLKEYYPNAQLVGEDYHKLYLTDFAPYLEKIKASGAEVIYSGNWPPDSTTLIKQSRQMRVNLPIAGWAIMADISGLQEIGAEGTKGLVKVDQYDVPLPFKNPDYVKYYKIWHNQWKNWSAPYNSVTYEHPSSGIGGHFPMQTYWLLSAIERAKSTNADKILAVLENDTYRMVNGHVVKMRACDHKAIQNLSVVESVLPAEQKSSMTIPPYYWFNNVSWSGKGHIIPASKVLPWMDQKLDRCKGKNDWGE